jgi:hypothetical protein
MKEFPPFKLPSPIPSDYFEIKIRPIYIGFGMEFSSDFGRDWQGYLISKSFSKSFPKSFNKFLNRKFKES